MIRDNTRNMDMSGIIPLNHKLGGRSTAGHVQGSVHVTATGARLNS